MSVQLRNDELIDLLRPEFLGVTRTGVTVTSTRTSTSTSSSLGVHDILSAYHTASGVRGLLVGLVADNTLGLIDPLTLAAKLWIGASEGPRVGMREMALPEGTVLALEVIDTANVAFFSASAEYITNAGALRIGYPGAPNIYLEDATAQAGEPEQARRMVVDGGCIDWIDGGGA